MSRSKIKGPFFKVNLIKNTKKKQWIKIYNKNLTILPEYIDHFVNIYNGKNFVNLKINEKMIGFKFGAFINTRKKHIYKKKK
jgi:small subunit ribosomal protein S19